MTRRRVKGGRRSPLRRDGGEGVGAAAERRPPSAGDAILLGTLVVACQLVLHLVAFRGGSDPATIAATVAFIGLAGIALVTLTIRETALRRHRANLDAFLAPRWRGSDRPAKMAVDAAPEQRP